MLKEVENIFHDIITSQVSVESDNVWIQDQNKVIPSSDNELFIIIGMVDAQVIANNNSIIPNTDGMLEQQRVVQRENIQIDLLSRDNKARSQRADILMALNSFYSTQQQEKYGFKIFRIPTSFVNSSEAEGSSQLNRFSIVIPTIVWYNNDNQIESSSGTGYYDDFNTRVDDEDTVGQPNGIIEFNIKG